VRGVNMSCVAGSGGADGPMIHRHSPWTPLITSPEAVGGQFLGSVSPGTRMDRCGRPSRCDWPTSVPCDAQPSLRDAYDLLGMTVVAVECGCIDPSASNLSLLIKPTIHRCILSIQGVYVGLLVLWTETWHMVGVGAPIGAAEPNPSQLRPTLASCGRLWCDRA
jgi:hypothetical protein